ncbi:LapA family protein [Paenibacillus tarimensis]|uniref:LapA family protein n=1 Tax=Paenibacillus tarimensis TaxID=416012 RepID=UPI001F445E1D|nr:lipopolysaccharide assembly protein LapA domain-containing protein [Paenibacillus tarimensis]MCF2944221.1 lipopolysaccharide assembly protein LapA domain-containing protein [Paenibacillus tarimensis]
MRVQWTIIAALLFALITAIFAVINIEPVEVNFWFTRTSLPLILVILISTLLGGLTVGLFGIIRQYRLQRRIRQLERELQSRGEELPPHSGSPVSGQEAHGQHDPTDMEPR